MVKNSLHGLFKQWFECVQFSLGHLSSLSKTFPKIGWDLVLDVFLLGFKSWWKFLLPELNDPHKQVLFEIIDFANSIEVQNLSMYRMLLYQREPYFRTDPFLERMTWLTFTHAYVNLSGKSWRYLSLYPPIVKNMFDSCVKHLI